jgi:hypothetical protein
MREFVAKDNTLLHVPTRQQFIACMSADRFDVTLDPKEGSLWHRMWEMLVRSR